MPDASPQSDASPQLESGTYEILRNRLRGHGEELHRRLDQLNSSRKEVFGSIDLKLLETERITTEHNCIPRDMVAVGRRFLFGYNVHFGLKAERHIADVFAVYEFGRSDESPHTQALQPLGVEILNNAQFQKDFQDIYRYYKDARFARFFVRGPHLFMVFQVGKSAGDVKTFKWLQDGDALRYLDNRSDHEVRFPPQHEFDWVRTTRDMHHFGTHPHVSIQDRLFVETVGGDLTIKVEDNTDSGAGIYTEPVDNPDQTLDDAEIHYAAVGNIILLKIRPYQEQGWRYIVYNEKIQQARRLDAIDDACVLLPDDQGLIFSRGYYLQSGEHKTFDTHIQGLKFARRVVSPNGEDTLYVFYQPDSGLHVLLGYNLISQQVDTPLICHGFTLFRGGEMLLFKAQPEPQKHHAVQVWQTPYVGPDYVPAQTTDSYLYKIGNRDIVRGMAECHEVLTLAKKEDTYAGLYIDLVRQTTDILDSYFWIGHADAANLAEPLRDIKTAAASAVEEFEKVTRVRQNTADLTRRVTEQTREILNTVGRRRFESIDEFVKSLAALRKVRGEIVGLRELRYVDAELVQTLEAEVTASAEQLSHRCVEFLLREDALAPYERAVAEEHAGIEHLTKVADARKVDEKIAASAGELEMLIEIVSNLKIDDATQRTLIIDNISAIFSQVNQARAALKRKTQELAQVEGAAEFGSQLKLLNQSVVNYLDVCDSPQKCEEYLTKLMVQVEELEGRFAEFNDFVVQLAEKRDEVYNAFETRRLALIEARNQRANTLAAAADRILKGVKTRVDGLENLSDIHGYFAADLMVEKVRDVVKQLEALGDSVKVDDIQSQLKTIREDAVRQLKDKRDLYEDGDHVIRFGSHRFSVNTQVLDLTTVQRDEQLCLHLTGTDFYEPLHDANLDATRNVWAMEVVSENREVYRAEYLAYQMLLSMRSDGSLSCDESSLLSDVQKFMAPRYTEGYIKGVHDHDTALILQELLQIEAGCGLLRFGSRARALANLFWHHFGDKREKALMASRLAGFGTIAELFPGNSQQADYIRNLRKMLAAFVTETGLFDGDSLLGEAATYLFHELTTSPADSRQGAFVVAQNAADVFRGFHEQLQTLQAEDRFIQSMQALSKTPAAAFQLARDWVSAFVSRSENKQCDVIDEVAVLLQAGQIDERGVIPVAMERTLTELSGMHPVIDKGTYQLHFNQFLHKLERFARETVPRYRTYHAMKARLVDEARDAMKLEEFKPRVLTSFVRNKLIDSVYLPLIGDNLAKQIGTTGADKRTDRQGLLLLISPPGYGKTTLMEYIANRLGIIFMKINGPAIGHAVTSLDPAAATNAGAREEIQKLNLAFEMSDNVMIYLDDIQHTHPELLQKFISLCDAQRKIEGVWKGKTRTYDFRGKKVCVVMAGNPYTESGEKFQIPDMLANRADIYNLGEIIGDSREAFEMSYLENALTSNPVLAKLAARSQQDVYAVIKLAQRAHGQPSAGPLDTEGVDLEGSYALEELGEFVSTMVKLMQVRDVVLKVNRAYILSAAQHDDYRTEPPFLLQGSYRNMNRIAEKVLPVMNDAELQTLIVSSYQNDAQTLTTGTEANLLKFKELLGILTDAERGRWEDIQKTFRQNVKLRGVGADDKVGQVIAQMSTFADGLDAIRKAVTQGVTQMLANGQETVDTTDVHLQSALERMDTLAGGLKSLADRLNEGLQHIVGLADRPIHVEVPPIDVKWPEHLPLATKPQAAGPVPTDDPAVLQHQVPLEDDARDSTGQTKRITVVNRIPRTVLNVLEQQFEVMNGWMRPLLERSDSQQDEIKHLGGLIEECLHDYRVLLRNLEKAEDRG